MSDNKATLAYSVLVRLLRCDDGKEIDGYDDWDRIIAAVIDESSENSEQYEKIRELEKHLADLMPQIAAGATLAAVCREYLREPVSAGTLATLRKAMRNYDDIAEGSAVPGANAGRGSTEAHDCAADG